MMWCNVAGIIVTTGLCFGSLPLKKTNVKHKLAAGWDRFENDVEMKWEEASVNVVYAKDEIAAKNKASWEKLKTNRPTRKKERQWKEIWEKLEEQEKKKKAQFKDAWEKLDLEGKQTWDEVVAQEEPLQKWLKERFREAWQKLTTFEKQFNYSSGCHCSKNNCGCCVDLKVN